MKLINLGIVLTTIAAAACAGPPVSGSAHPTYERDVEPVIVKRCAGCHSADKPKAKLILEKGAGYRNLVEKPSTEVPTVLRVKPGDPAGSYMWRKLTHTASEGKGMPRTLFGSKKLKAKELALIRQWIEGGALP